MRAFIYTMDLEQQRLTHAKSYLNHLLLTSHHFLKVQKHLWSYLTAVQRDMRACLGKGMKGLVTQAEEATDRLFRFYHCSKV